MGCTQSSAAGVAPPSAEQVKERIEASKETCSATFGGVSVRYAYLCQRGYYPGDDSKENQDSYSVTANYAGRKSDAFFGVYDGHGEHGHKCSRFVRDNLPKLLAAGLSQVEGGDKASNAQLTSVISNAHRECNKKMDRKRDIDDDWSGTTSISVFLRGNLKKITVSNVGDSRAVIGSQKGAEGAIVASALSKDQTPFRKDERERIRQRGGRIMTEEQLMNPKRGKDTEWEGDNGNGDIVLGEELDQTGQPPRVFSSHGDYPGLTTTRTIGDRVIANEGVVGAEPEILNAELESKDKIIVLASDGVWEFITNQQVIDMCVQVRSTRVWPIIALPFQKRPFQHERDCDMVV
ncbi:hypothetical protein ACHAWF_005334 [Thalassiosira exigua]